MQRRQPLKTRPAVTAAAALSLPFSPIQSPPAAFLQNLCIQKYPCYTNFEFCNIISLNTQIGFWCIQHNVNLVIALPWWLMFNSKKERKVDPKNVKFKTLSMILLIKLDHLMLSSVAARIAPSTKFSKKVIFGWCSLWSNHADFSHCAGHQAFDFLMKVSFRWNAPIINFNAILSSS